MLRARISAFMETRNILNAFASSKSVKILPDVSIFSVVELFTLLSHALDFECPRNIRANQE